MEYYSATQTRDDHSDAYAVHVLSRLLQLQHLSTFIILITFI